MMLKLAVGRVAGLLGLTSTGGTVCAFPFQDLALRLLKIYRIHFWGANFSEAIDKL